MTGANRRGTTNSQSRASSRPSKNPLHAPAMWYVQQVKALLPLLTTPDRRPLPLLAAPLEGAGIARLARISRLVVSFIRLYACRGQGPSGTADLIFTFLAPGPCRGCRLAPKVPSSWFCCSQAHAGCPHAPASSTPPTSSWRFPHYLWFQANPEVVRSLAVAVLPVGAFHLRAEGRAAQLAQVVVGGPLFVALMHPRRLLHLRTRMEEQLQASSHRYASSHEDA